MNKRFIFIGLFLIGGSLLGFYVSGMDLIHYLRWERYNTSPTHVFSYSFLIIGTILLLKGLGLNVSLPWIKSDIKMLTNSKNDFSWAWLIGLGIFGLVLCGIIYYIFNYL